MVVVVVVEASPRIGTVCDAVDTVAGLTSLTWCCAGNGRSISGLSPRGAGLGGLCPFLSLHAIMATLQVSPTSPRNVRRRGSTRRRAGSHLPPYPSQDTHDNALHAIRSFLKATTSYDAFPVSFRLIVLDTKLNVKKALQCLLLNGVQIQFLSYPI